MTRVMSLGLLVAAVAGVAAPPVRAQKQLPVAPPPRAVRPDGTRAPAPQPAKAEDPAAVVDRIIKNSKDVGDRLEKTDTGTDTRKKQDAILSDIDALINRQEDPPPPKPDDKDKDDKQKDKNKDDKKDDMNKDPMPNKDMPPKGDMPMDKGDKKDMGMGKNDMPPPKHEDAPMGGMNDPPMPMGGAGRKPRMGDPTGDDKKDQQPEQKPDGKKQQGAPKDSKDQKNPSGGAAGGPGGKLPAKSLLPADDGGSKDVWGHLPDKLRQQMTQYYSEDIMPKYAELLRLYYSSFSEAGAAPVMPKK